MPPPPSKTTATGFRIPSWTCRGRGFDAICENLKVIGQIVLVIHIFFVMSLLHRFRSRRSEFHQNRVLRKIANNESQNTYNH